MSSERQFEKPAQIAAFRKRHRRESESHHAFRYNSRMEDFILDILARIRELGRALAANELEDIVRAHNQGIRENKSHISKRRALPFFLKVRESDPQRWSS